MIRRLQRKFICIVMLSLGLVILLLLGSINLLKYHSTDLLKIYFVQEKKKSCIS